MTPLLYIFIGGGIGSVLRYLVGIAFKTKSDGFPLATFIINVIGSLVIGLLVGYFTKYSSADQQLKFLLIVGFCGGFTTFSTFSLETLTLLQNHQYLTAILYIVGSVVCGLAATYFGYQLTK